MSEYVVFDKRAFEVMAPKLATDEVFTWRGQWGIVNSNNPVFSEDKYRRLSQNCTPAQIAFIESLDEGKDLGKEGDEKCDAISTVGQRSESPAPIALTEGHHNNAAVDENATPAAAISDVETLNHFYEKWRIRATDGTMSPAEIRESKIVSFEFFCAGVDFAVSKMKGDKVT